MEIADVLRTAVEAVEEAGVPADLRPLAFTTAVGLVMSGPGAPSVAAAPRVPVSFHAPPVPAVPDAAGSGSGSGSGSVAAVSPAAGSVPVPGAGSPAGAAGSAGAAGTADALRVGAHAPGVVGQGSGHASGQGSGHSGGHGTGHGSGLDLRPLADAVGVPVERLDRLYDGHSGVIELCGDPARLGRTRAERVGNAVLLLLAAQRWSGRDAGAAVPDALVRAEVARLGLLDVGNYSKHLAARRSLWATAGSGRTASYRLRYDGVEEARRLARTLLDEPAT